MSRNEINKDKKEKNRIVRNMKIVRNIKKIVQQGMLNLELEYFRNNLSELAYFLEKFIAIANVVSTHHIHK